MEKLKSRLGARPKYLPVEASDQIEDSTQSSQRDALQNNNATREGRLDAADDWAKTRNRFTRIHYLASFQGLVIVLLVLFIFVSHRRRAAGSVHLGTDPSGFVPKGVGEPPRWTKYDDLSDAHHFREDVFESIENVRKAASHFKTLHNASGVYINGDYSTYRGFDNETHDLPPYVTRKGSELYSIRAFHQMHCVSIILEDIGYRIHNMSSKWTTGHVIHCINTLRAAVTCLADATPISGVGHTTDDQQAWCRDFYALREWAHDPVRAVRWMNMAPADEPDQYVELDRDT
ncbi:hypothetical protein INS49_005223 [Diaporthe citri]|uniref:uncharacterized protein n=1 Tax=Diaporthe citri TaxID=83186 RepID=UPI001C805A70|nr:uncharacterized protein INS49_005223 [Diaporthe citri]KAG6353965.1 hypothetical protein INS49_005223 [Diaporthe citri]